MPTVWVVARLVCPCMAPRGTGEQLFSCPPSTHPRVVSMPLPHHAHPCIVGSMHETRTYIVCFVSVCVSVVVDLRCTLSVWAVAAGRPRALCIYDYSDRGAPKRGGRSGRPALGLPGGYRLLQSCQLCGTRARVHRCRPSCCQQPGRGRIFLLYI